MNAEQMLKKKTGRYTWKVLHCLSHYKDKLPGWLWLGSFQRTRYHEFLFPFSVKILHNKWTHSDDSKFVNCMQDMPYICKKWQNAHARSWVHT